ncbi:unnamed protein product [Toxocara canis]|uniref:Transposase n=1 Tax=Toxocara canis TaxID=6265 RepID=A0A183U6Y4_TOXCA|nr:unnamed protein product [Toxocara canis]
MGDCKDNLKHIRLIAVAERTDRPMENTADCKKGTVGWIDTLARADTAVVIVTEQTAGTVLWVGLHSWTGTGRKTGLGLVGIVGIR